MAETKDIQFSCLVTIGSDFLGICFACFFSLKIW